GAAHQAQQLSRVVEEAARVRGLHDLLEHGDGEVRLADARRAFEEQRLGHHRKRFGEAPCGRRRTLERFVVDGEVRDRAVLIALRNVRAGEALPADGVAPAIAANDAARAVLVDRTPAGVIAQWTSSHDSRTLTTDDNEWSVRKYSLRLFARGF